MQVWEESDQVLTIPLLSRMFFIHWIPCMDSQLQLSSQRAGRSLLPRPEVQKRLIQEAACKMTPTDPISWNSLPGQFSFQCSPVLEYGLDLIAWSEKISAKVTDFASLPSTKWGPPPHQLLRTRILPAITPAWRQILLTEPPASIDFAAP